MWYFIRVKIYRMATLQCYNINMSSRFVKIGQSRAVLKTEQPNRPRLPWGKSQSAFKESKFRLYLIKRYCSKHKCFLSTKGSLTPASFHIYQLVVFVSTPCTELTQTRSPTVITPGHADSQRLACLHEATENGNSESSTAPEKCNEKKKRHEENLTSKWLRPQREGDIFKHKVLQKEYNVTLV